MTNDLNKTFGPVTKSVSPFRKFKLPEKENEPSHVFTDYGWYIHGPDHVGKTSLLVQWPDTFFISFDPINISYKYKASFIPDYKEFKLCVNDLCSKPGYCKTIVIDNTKKLNSFCQMQAAEDLGIDHVADAKMSKGWSHAGQLLLKPLNKLVASGYKIMGITHTMLNTWPGYDGVKIEKLTPNGGTAANSYFGSGLAITAYFYKTNSGERELMIRGTYSIEAETKVDGHFLYTDGSPISIIPMGKSEQEGYKNIQLAFHNKLEKPKPKVFKTINKGE